jgi:hypothetical protein
LWGGGTGARLSSRSYSVERRREREQNEGCLQKLLGTTESEPSFVQHDSNNTLVTKNFNQSKTYLWLTWTVDSKAGNSDSILAFSSVILAIMQLFALKHPNSKNG